MFKTRSIRRPQTSAEFLPLALSRS